MGRLKLLYEGGNSPSGGPSFLWGVNPSRHHVLKKKRIISWIFHFILLRVIEVVKLKNKSKSKSKK